MIPGTASPKYLPGNFSVLISCVYMNIYVYVYELVFTERCNDFILIISSFNNCLCHFKFSNYKLFFYYNCDIISSIRDNIFITEF